MRKIKWSLKLYKLQLYSIYDMEATPWKELCDVYWDILKGQILMK